MATALFEDIIFGPVLSRRLGLSLGVNLLPLSSKYCTFNCIYCECGWTPDKQKADFNSREDVAEKLRAKLTEMVSEGTPPDVITFAGNGEPTTHPQFERIIDDVVAIRDEISPHTKISVLSNATMIGRESIRRALMKVDNNILKLDSAFDETVRTIDVPLGNYPVRRIVDWMKLFGGDLTVQTMFLRGEYDGHKIDNTTEREVEAWLQLIAEIHPKQVMIYTIARDTPAPDLVKVPIEELNAIASRVEALGIPCSVSG